METKRGWEVIWRSNIWCEVVPMDDLKQHLMGDECWCQPTVVRFNLGGIEIDHNSADGREEQERKEQHDGQRPNRT